MLLEGRAQKKSYISSPSKSALNLSITERLNWMDCYVGTILTHAPPKDSSRTEG